MVAFGIAFAYIESAVVVYLRAIFYPDGFVFPLVGFGDMAGLKHLFLTEVGREAATLVLILAGSYALACNWRRFLAWFLIIFAVWDIFYYVWLKVLLDWPGSLLDWDILFFIPVIWASPVLAPIISSLVMLLAGAILLSERAMRVTAMRAAGFMLLTLATVTCFCIAGLRIDEPDYRSSFSWPVFIAMHIYAVVLLLRCLERCGVGENPGEAPTGLGT